MKNLKNALYFLALVTFVTACSKDDEAPSHVFTAKISGTDFKATTIFGTHYSDATIEIVGVNGDFMGFEITMNDDLTAGEYNLEDGELSITYYDEDLDAYEAESGTINITTLSATRFEATFNVVVENDANEEIQVTSAVVKSDIDED